MKREATVLQTKSAEKKARLEAEFVQNFNHDFTELQIENILKEVSAPDALVPQLEQWKKKFLSTLKELSFEKLDNKKTKRLMSSMNKNNETPVDFNFPGGKIVDCVSGCRLSGDQNPNLVFPNAKATIFISFKYNQKPKGDSRKYNSLFFHQLQNKLSSNGSVLQCRKSASSVSGSERLVVVPNLPKLKKQLEIFLELRSGEVEGLTVGFQDELNRLHSNENYRKAEQLSQIWIRQLKLWIPEGLMTTVLLHLHLLNQLNTNMKPWSVVRRVWTFLSECREHGGKIILGVLTHIPDIEFTSPILDRDGARPLYPELTRVQWNALCSFAEGALSVDIKDSLLIKYSMGALFDKVVRFSGSMINVTKLVEELYYALGERITSLVCLEDDLDGILIGLLLNPSQCLNQATLGPNSDEIKEAKKFREFWGERSELRRFQDGIVREAVVWSKNKSEIIGEILRTVITRRWSGVTLTEYESYNRNILNGDGGASCRQYLDQITPILYGLEDIALSITAVIALGEELRLSRVGTQSSGWDIKKGDYRGEDMCKKLQDEFSVPPYVTVMDVLLSPLRSGKWPEDQEAVRRLKIAWLSEVGNALENKLRDIKQFIFEENLLIVDTKKKVALRFYVTDQKSGILHSLGELSSWLSSLAIIHPAWSVGVRLAKRWMSAHFMADIVPDVAIELIMARVFLWPGQFSTSPNSAGSAFQRFLQILSTHDWNEAPLLVSPEVSFCEKRETLPPMAIISPKDPSPSFWSKPGPTWSELNRLVTLAHLTIQKLDSQTEPENFLAVFLPTLKSFDFLIQLDPYKISNRNLSVGNKYIGTTCEGKDTQVPILEYDPALIFVKELNESFPNIGKFYYDKYGGSVIGVTVNKDLGKKVKLGNIGGYMTRGRETELNWGAIVEDWQILGQGLVKSVTCQNSNIF